MRNPQFHESGKRPIEELMICDIRHCLWAMNGFSVMQGHINKRIHGTSQGDRDNRLVVNPDIFNARLGRNL